MWWEDLFRLFFPSLCLVCGKRLPLHQKILCLGCELGMPGFIKKDDRCSALNQTFWGRVPVEMSTSLFRFEKGSPYRQLLHDLKYGKNPFCGVYLGRILGYELKHSGFSACDLLVPVPIHSRRLKERGYNQSEMIGKGISRVTGIPQHTRLLVRSTHHSSQTSRGRYERFQNIRNNFCLHPKAPDINGCKILLVDDVLTTGATLEACCTELLKHYNCLIYVATLAYA